MSFIRFLLPAALVGGAVLAFTASDAQAKSLPTKNLSPAQARDVEQALSTGDPRAIREIATELAAAGFPEQAADLRKAADAIEAAVRDVPPVKPGDKPVITTGGVGFPPFPTTGTVPEQPSAAKVLAGKTALMLLNSSPGRENKGMVKDYQLQEQSLGHTSVGKADGLYGPKTALTLARHYNIVPPKPYYYPRADRAGAKASYRAEILTFAAKDAPRAEEWREAARV